MNSFLRFCAPLGLALAVSISGAACGGGDDPDDKAEETSQSGLTSEAVAPAANAEAIAFTPDGRLFFAEHWTGAIRVVGADGQPLPDPWATVPNLAADAYWGLTGLAIDPEFDSNGYVYALYTELIQAGPPPIGKPVLVRFTERDAKGTDIRVIVSDLPEANWPTGPSVNGTINFGPDGFLYLTLGDYGRPLEAGPLGQPLPLDLGSPIGKVLRVTKEDGSAPADNPFVNQPGADPRIFAYGFRSPFNFAFHPESGRMYGSDNNNRSCEELNIIDKGADYGWPATENRDCGAPPHQSPIHLLALDGLQPIDTDSTVGVSGMEFVSGDVYPMLGDSLVFCEARPQLIRTLTLEAPSFERATGGDVIGRDCWDVTISPDGLIYYGSTYDIRRLVHSGLSPSAPLAASAPSAAPLAEGPGSHTSDAIIWWLAIELIGLAAFPLSFAALRFLPDRGYSVTKVVGILVMSYLLWLGGVVHLLPNRRLSIIGILVLIASISAVLTWRHRSELSSFLSKRWAHLLFADALFTAVFLLCLFLRSNAADSLIGGNDNRFTIAFVNAILRTEYFPPEDPWLSGHSISYYYFAFVIVGALTKLTAIASDVTFNLTIALIPALAVSGMFGIVYNFLIDRGRLPLVFACGVLAGVFLIFLSNIESLFELMAIHGVGSQGFFDALDVVGLGFYRSSPEWFPTDGAWTFRSINFSGHRFDSVFPFFDLLLPVGYLSGRNTAIPIVLLVVTAMVNVWRSDSTRFRGIGRADILGVGFIVLPLGALSATHAWDFPTVSVLILATFLCRNYWLEGGFNVAVLTRSALFVAAIVVLAALLYLPYFIGASGQFHGILTLQPEVSTEPHHLLYLWLPLFWLAACLAMFALPGFRLNDPILWAVAAIPVLVVVSWAGYRVVDGSVSELREDIEVRGEAWISVAILASLFALTGLALLKQVMTIPVDRREPPLVFALILTATALLLILGIEFFYVKESTSIIVFDITTVLRVNFQGWLLLSLAGAFSIYYIAASWSRVHLPVRPLLRSAWAGVTIAVVSAGLLFPVMAGFFYEDLIGDLHWGRHLDGLAGLRRVQPDEYEAIQYLKNDADGTPVIMEAVTDSYQSGGRISAYTGLPTVLGWVTHEFWFRGTYEPWTHRREDVALAYRTPSPAAAADILREYDVEYVVFGRLERQQYGETGFAKFTTFMDTVFQRGEVTIYRIRTDEALTNLPP